MESNEQPQPTQHREFVVALGASAGGLEALEKFFAACPTDTGLPFIVIQHLSPDHKSMMADLLGRYTAMPIKLVEEGMPIQPNHVYLIPAGTIMRVVGGHFVLTQKTPHVLSLPIDIFFTSMAEEYGDKAIGIILSGTGSDGTRGAYVINESGGFLLAQSPKEAKFNGMPNSVIATGLIDDVLDAEQLAERLLDYVKNPQKIVKQDTAQPGLDYEDPTHLIFHYLAQTTGVDFHQYKQATVTRRIERRMQVKHISDVKDYAKLLEIDRTELANLRRELFIPVTRFFRDTPAFDDLQTIAIDDIVSKAENGNGIRIWSAGISSGEEVYSIAILFFEAFERARRWPNLKIFATDVNPQAIELASAGHYPESIAAEVSPERLQRFFSKSGNEYIVKPELRQVVVFAKHNLLADPPFTRMDLVTCRNTLIYFQAEPQNKALQRLQYATKPGGYLFLGSSESINAIAKGFDTVHAKSKIFRRNYVNMPLIGLDNSKNSLKSQPRLTRQFSKLNALETAEVALLDETSHQLINAYSPPGFLVNDHQEIIHLYGDVKPFYKIRAGAASMDITRILPDGLISVVSALLFKALKDQKVFYSDRLKLELEPENPCLLRVCVRPISSNADEKFALVLFEPLPLQHDDPQSQTINLDDETAARIEVLQQELAATRESLQATIEELETSNEELQATNEELMASNEELQSSNEELQSVNEELNTVNAEYQEKVLRLNQLNADLDTMAKAVGVATIFVDHNLNISRFSPDAVGLFKLRDSDLGRPLSDLHHSFDNEHLIDYFEQTLKTTLPFETELIHQNHKSYLLRILPYKIPSSDKHGAVASFIDVTGISDQ
ncbi:PAS domain-containing protein [Thiomicrospira microaerophila]|uniref:chemotaxis protein CheB n=1 Tax=Thiomicrospira microaerophila TaxID=406020 RepID=UPI00200CCD22|nr:chemotaxis protein CheB [Thiomicrospira microaerophila]UQB41772.1 PAS domain-containing protein [Thiomicrospira microaerophila]